MRKQQIKKIYKIANSVGNGEMMIRALKAGVSYE